MKLDFPHTARNTQPILEVLKEVLPDDGLVVEIASGSGQQIVSFAESFPRLSFQPSDVDPAHLASIEAYVAESELSNLQKPLELDVREGSWPIEIATAVININMIHISEWQCAEGLFAGASRILRSRGVLYLYGPFHVEGKDTAESNQRFDQSLQSRNPAWGLRWLGEVERLGEQHGFSLERTVDMPANNLSVVFRRGD